MGKAAQGPSQIPDLAEGDLGPAMLALNTSQRRFVLAMIETPGCSASRAAILAGYSNIKEAAKVRGHHLMQNPAVQAAIHEVTSKRLRSHSLLAADVVIKLASDPKVPAAERLKAAGMLLDRAGFAAVQNINVNKTVTDVTEKGIEDRLQRALARLRTIGLDPAGLLGLTAPGEPVVEAEFTEVKE